MSLILWAASQCGCMLYITAQHISFVSRSFSQPGIWAARFPAQSLSIALSSASGPPPNGAPKVSSDRDVLSTTIGVHITMELLAAFASISSGIIVHIAIISTTLHTIMTCWVFRLLKLSQSDESDGFTPTSFMLDSMSFMTPHDHRSTGSYSYNPHYWVGVYGR